MQTTASPNATFAFDAREELEDRRSINDEDRVPERMAPPSRARPTSLHRVHFRRPRSRFRRRGACFLFRLFLN